MIKAIIDVEANGIYAVGSKLGHMSQLINTAFGSGWLYFAYSTMHDDDQVKTNTKVLEYLGIISFAASIVVFVLSEPLYQIMFEKEYVPGYIVAPYLFLAPLLQMMFQVSCNQFMVMKKSWPNMVILLFGAIVNVGLNAILIPAIGIEGAAIATLLGYLVSLTIAIVVLTKINLMKLSPVFLIATAVMTAFILLWRLFAQHNLILGILMGIIAIVIMIVLYRNDISMIFKGMKRKHAKG